MLKSLNCTKRKTKTVPLYNQSINQSITLYLNMVKSSVFTFIIYKKKQVKRETTIF